MRRRQRVYAYSTHAGRFLVFEHPDHPDAGIQVPAGTVKSGESPNEAVLREAREETGLSGLNKAHCLGSFEHDVREFGVEETPGGLLLPHSVCGRSSNSLDSQ